MIVNVVSFTVPFPPDYGGAIDVFYKLKTLSELGLKVILHCYTYRDRTVKKELEDICFKVHYYERDLNPAFLFSRLPYIVRSRSNIKLIENLLGNEYPILFEGLHTTYPLYTGLLNGRKIIVRTHNVEHKYYAALAQSESNLLRRLYFKLESLKLKRYESVLNNVDSIAAISPNDLDYFLKYSTNVFLVTPFHPFDRLDVKKGRGDYILIHADLSVTENVKSTIWLIDNVLKRVKHNVVIAGKSPKQVLYDKSKGVSNIQIINDPNRAQMDELIQNAHINITHSLNSQGFKLKLLYSLFKGRHCLCNREVVYNTGLEKLCNVADSADDYVNLISLLMSKKFEETSILERESLLGRFSNAWQAEILVKHLKG
ncbi:MAG: hypothetical protein PWR03_1834 [Tenuifilum sp.]|jgi:hypothetical protein|uniref:glycosyltransferase family 1 protein n=1 Tax=Tenuifilum sp. TaxID=2760880 RepID=UPI0024AB0648|nr:glycosyltransferase family 1 protein [Tenuifilum sp.]MDI3527651.1 hypothetical protein [Tenuifilum sp.]